MKAVGYMLYSIFLYLIKHEKFDNFGPLTNCPQRLKLVECFQIFSS